MVETTRGRIGTYVCKVGYLDIRQRVSHKAPTKVFVVHSKSVVAGPYKSIEKAREEAQRCVSQGIKYDKHRK